MKITSIIKEVEGIPEAKAQQIWDALEKNGAYQFNKSHAVAYTLISYQSMWLKTYYPAQFFAAALTILPEEKHTGLVLDAQEYGIKILPPDINISSNRYELVKNSLGRFDLYAPFSSVKGCSEVGARAILEAREKVGGKFDSVEQFEEVVAKRSCNSKVRTNLGLVGAYASIQPETPSAIDPIRLKDQAELMGAIVTDAVKITREFVVDKITRREINELMDDLRDRCDLSIAKPYIGNNPKLMIILDYPNKGDIANGDFFTKGYDEFKGMLKNFGLDYDDFYVTGVGKSLKDKGSYGYPLDLQNMYYDYINKEISLVKPTYILAAGSMACSLFNNDKKASDLVGQKEYLKHLDATVFYAFNPSILFFRPEEVTRLELVLQTISDTI